MNTLWESYFAGVFSSISAFLVVWFVTKWAWPRLRNRLQKGPKISGEWKSTFKEDGVSKTETVDVSQIGENISGTMALTEKDRITVTGTELKHRINPPESEAA